MIENIERLRDEAKQQIELAPDGRELDRIRVHYLGKKGLLTGMLHQLKDLDPEKRRQTGAFLNEVKTAFEALFVRREAELDRQSVEQELAASKPIDVTLPGRVPQPQGSLHPITRVLDDMIRILGALGFSLATGPEVELDEYNFQALNMPENHPARDMQDTFYVDTQTVLRTHTSPMQIRAMRSMQPPLQLIMCGKVYRADSDATHSPMFHQLEVLAVDEGLAFSDLKGILRHVVRELFGARPLRFRPSYFPFVEPGAEVDMQCFQCRGQGCRLCKDSGWIEIGGCGMVHPYVLRSGGIDPDELSGYAFGFGIERIAMLRYGIEDIRAFFENDTRMLEQF